MEWFSMLAAALLFSACAKPAAPYWLMPTQWPFPRVTKLHDCADPEYVNIKFGEYNP